jgi:hypothetical protein
VNTYHHQGLDRLGDGLRAVAHAEDGLVEAVEGTDGAWLLGVQWHPEMSYATHPDQRVPFLEAFLDAPQPRPPPCPCARLRRIRRRAARSAPLRAPPRGAPMVVVMQKGAAPEARERVLRGQARWASPPTSARASRAR